MKWFTGYPYEFAEITNTDSFVYMLIGYIYLRLPNCKHNLFYNWDEFDGVNAPL